MAKGGSLHHAPALDRELGPVLAFLQCLRVRGRVCLAPRDYLQAGILSAGATGCIGQLGHNTGALARATGRAGA